MTRNNSQRTYTRTWTDIEEMLDKAERKQNMHFSQLQRKRISKKDRLMHMRNYKALEGVVKTLKWVCGEKGIDHPLE